MKTDILIVESGCSGLYAAIHLPADKQITIITKEDLESSDSFLAQGGICMLRDEDDYDDYYKDTMKAGHCENNPRSVDIMIRDSQRIIADLIGCGVDFEREEDGSLAFTKEGAHSEKRILFHEDITGREITGKLLQKVRSLPNVTMMEYTTMVDLVEEDNVCYGAVLRMKDGSPATVAADFTCLACGGIGGLYRHSTNFRHLTGDALAIAIRHGIKLENLNYVQIHPTTFYTENEEERSFLISESVRGEGALLYNKDMERFVDELQPRDIVTQAILRQMEKDGTDHVWEDLRPIPREELLTHFPNIVEYCREHGYDPEKECIPVVPAQLICKQDGVICGLEVFARVFALLAPETDIAFEAAEGDTVRKGQRLATVSGDMRAILSGERTALNYLQRMSGIATYTREIVELLEGSGIRLLDTRKTTPNNRIFEKYAVRIGGGCSHRYNLSDGVMLKDNHIGAAGGVKEAVRAAKEYAPFVRKIEVEAETLQMVREAMEAGADIIMLDNMDHDQMRQAIEIIGGKAEIEISGSVTAQRIAQIKDLKADFISSGALTHSAPIMDISLKDLHPIGQVRQCMFGDSEI